MTISRNLSDLANQVDSSGTLLAGGGGTGITSVGASGNVLTSNGTAWTSAAPPSGGQYYGTATTKAIAYNANSISENITILANTNGLSAGPITINTSYTVTVQTDAVWVIV